MYLVNGLRSLRECHTSPTLESEAFTSSMNCCVGSGWAQKKNVILNHQKLSWPQVSTLMSLGQLGERYCGSTVVPDELSVDVDKSQEALKLLVRNWPL